MKKIWYYLNIFYKLIFVKRLKIVFTNYNDNSLSNYKATFNYFTRRHRCKIIKNKTLGVAIIVLEKYQDFQSYLKSINGKNKPAYYSRKAVKRNYKFKEIDRNDYIDDIHEINISAKTRQGMPMDAAYLEKKYSYEKCEIYKIFGVVNDEGTLVSYCDFGFYGEFVVVEKILGHKKYLNDGIMYFMLIQIIKGIYEKVYFATSKYIIYDTYFGASDGLKMFKRKLGFEPYRVKWVWQNENDSY